MPFLKSFELGPRLGFRPIILATDVLASQSRALIWYRARSEHIFGDETVLLKVSIVFLYCR